MGVVLDTVGQWIAGYLQKEVPGYEPFTPSDPEHLRGIMEPGDVLLVEGTNRVSGIIKYLTQSTWSHGALFVGPIDGAVEDDGEPHVLIEAIRRLAADAVAEPLSDPATLARAVQAGLLDAPQLQRNRFARGEIDASVTRSPAVTWRVDGNSVDIDLEVTLLAQNQGRYQAMTRAMADMHRLYRVAITGSGR